MICHPAITKKNVCFFRYMPSGWCLCCVYHLWLMCNTLDTRRSFIALFDLRRHTPAPGNRASRMTNWLWQSRIKIKKQEKRHRRQNECNEEVSKIRSVCTISPHLVNTKHNEALNSRPVICRRKCRKRNWRAPFGEFDIHTNGSGV